MYTRATRIVAAILLCCAASPVFAQQQTVIYQTGGAGPAVDTVSRSCSIRESTAPSGASVLETFEILVGSEGAMTNAKSLIDFPNIFGSGPNQIPYGSIINSATLRLWCTDAGGASHVGRPVVAILVSDYPERLGSWHEPESHSPLPQLDVGVSWIRRDSRPLALGGGIPWTTGGTEPNLATSATLAAMFPGLNPLITVVPDGSTGIGINNWHDFDLSQMAHLWSLGFSNQGLMLYTPNNFAWVKYASDDATNATLRPQLEITWSPGPAPFNHVPEILGTNPPVPTCAQGSSVAMTLMTSDGDGEFNEVRVLKRPAHGELIAVPPFFSYRPEPGFTGQDDFIVSLRDTYASSASHRVVINVSPAAGSSTSVFQAGTGSAGATRASGVRIGTAASAQLLFEDEEFNLKSGFDRGFVEFSDLIGSGTDQIPPGATILHAALELTVPALSSPSLDRHLLVERVIDPLDRGIPWHEAAGTFAEPAGGLNEGVSHLYLDARPIASGGQGIAWDTPGGDVHPIDASTMFIEGGFFSNGDRFQADVTSSVQAWVDGAPNQGWRLQSDSTSSTRIASDDHSDPSIRPKLVVTWLAPGQTPGFGTLPAHAHAGPDRRVFAHQTVTLDARGSESPDGSTPLYYWFRTSGPSVTLVAPPSSTSTLPPNRLLTPQFVAPAVTQATNLEFLLVAQVGTTFALDTVTIEVLPQPGGSSFGSPVVDPGPTLSVTEITSVNLAASISGGVGPFEVHWTKLEGPPITFDDATSLSPSFVSPPVSAAGAELLLQLSVRDLGVSFESVTAATLRILVNDAPNAVPIANAGPDATVDEGTWLVLDAGASSDPDGQPLVFTWTQISGPTVNLSDYVTAGTAAAARLPLRAPAVSSTATMIFEVSAFDGENAATDQVSITVRPELASFIGNADSMAPYRSELTRSEARHFLRRCGFGWHPDLVEVMVNATRNPTLGLGAIVNLIVRPYDPTDASVLAVHDEALNYSPAIATGNVPQLNQPFDPYPSLSRAQMEVYWLTWAFRSPNPFVERMVRFWNDRLAASGRGLGGGKRWWNLVQADTLRFGRRVPCAGGTGPVDPMTCPLVPGTGPLGNYREILIDFARDAVTLAFVDGFDNLRFAPNENFAREFFELYTLGLYDPMGVPLYDETDVREAARAFTGWRPVYFSVNPNNAPSPAPSFVPFFHDYGTKVVLGSAPTDFDDIGIVDLVLNYDGGVNASRWLARGILEHFVTAEPSEMLVTNFGTTIRNQNWDLQAAMRILMKSEAFFAATARKSIVATPVDFATSVVKTLDISLQTQDFAMNNIRSSLFLLDQILGAPEDVNGFRKDTDWIDEFAIVQRSELLRRIAIQARTPTVPDPGSATTFPDYPGFGQDPIDFSPWLPPQHARFAEESTQTLAERLDVDLKTAAVNGGSQSEFEIVAEYLDTPATPPFGTPFDANEPTDANQSLRFLSTLILLLEHPESFRF